MLAAVELRTAQIWCELLPQTNVQLEYWQTDLPHIKKIIDGHKTGKFEFDITEFYLTGLEPGTTYNYRLILNKKMREERITGSFKTQLLWQFRTDPPDFTFLGGSCSFMNEDIFDRPGAPFGKDINIYDSMAAEDASFMLWLGDNWYYREVDYGSEWGMWYRASRDRSHPSLQGLLKKMPQYAIWDDHDYGPNNANAAFNFKYESAIVFNSYWSNPGKNHAHEGIYSQFSYADADFFLMDDRSFRSSDKMKDSISGQINFEKQMWGNDQLKWLKNQLLESRATFKFIVNGTPVLNEYNKHDCMIHYLNEYQQLMKFILDEKIEGIIFLTGDRHHSEICKKEIAVHYTLFDIVSSSLTAATNEISSAEKKNPDLIQDMSYTENNYSRFSISGKPKERIVKIEFMNVKGIPVRQMIINQSDLKFK
jgi:alkaline phosphatase D